jgi:tocopherol O-methyltransferase
VGSQIDRAKRYAVERGLADKVDFRLGDYRAMDFPDESFDVVWIQEALVHVDVDDKHRFANEAFRVLKPGGRVVITEYLRRARPLPESDERLLASWSQGWAMADLATRDELEECFIQAGFGQVRLDDITDKVTPSLRRLYQLSLALYPFAWALHRARIRDDAAHGNVLSSLTQWQALRRGAWSYTLALAVKS